MAVGMQQPLSPYGDAKQVKSQRGAPQHATAEHMVQDTLWPQPGVFKAGRLGGCSATPQAPSQPASQRLTAAPPPSPPPRRSTPAAP